MTVEVARKLDIQRMVLVVNKVPLSLDLDAVETQIEKIYNCDVARRLVHKLIRHPTTDWVDTAELHISG